MLITQNAAEAEEAAQDGFVKAWRALRSLPGGRAAAPVAADDRRQRGAQPAPLGRPARRRWRCALEPRAGRPLGRGRRCSRPSRARAAGGARAAARRTTGSCSAAATCSSSARPRPPPRSACRLGTVKSRTSRALGAPARGGGAMTELEHALRELEVDWPATPDLAAAVARAARGDARAPRRGAPAPRWRRRLARRAAPSPRSSCSVGGTLAVSPAARSTVSRWLGLTSVEIKRERRATPRRSARRVARTSARRRGRAPPARRVPRRARHARRRLPRRRCRRRPRADVARLPPRPACRVEGHRRRAARADVPGRASTPFIEKTLGHRRRRAELDVDGAPAYWIDRRARLRLHDARRPGATSSRSGSPTARCSSSADGLLIRVEGTAHAAIAPSRSRAQFSDGSGGIVASSA